MWQTFGKWEACETPNKAAPVSAARGYRSVRHSWERPRGCQMSDVERWLPSRALAACNATSGGGVFGLGDKRQAHLGTVSQTQVAECRPGQMRLKHATTLAPLHVA